MKFLHTSDLHLGMRLMGYSLVEDQKHILNEILKIAKREKPDGIIIAGDVYDKPLPPVDAVALFDGFLTDLAGLDIPVFIISGNHDSAERLSFGGRLMTHRGIHISPAYSGRVEPVTLTDEWGEVCVYLLPFVKPASVRRFAGDTEITDYTDALRAVIGDMKVDTDKRNVLVSHQFVTGGKRCESESVTVGGVDNVDASVFDSFDYVALGHLHSPQVMAGGRIRYSGTPLKYSFSEADDEKSVSLVTVDGEGSVEICPIPLHPIREMRVLRGSYDGLMLKSFYDNTTYREDYVRIILTDEEDIPDGAAKLRTVYRNLMRLDYDNCRTRSLGTTLDIPHLEEKTPGEILGEFYEHQNGRPMNGEQSSLASRLIEELWGESL